MRAILRTPRVLSLFVASCVARLPMGAFGLLLVLHTQQLTGSYAKGGLASGAYALSLGLTNPLLARLVDRRGQTLVHRWPPPRWWRWPCCPMAPHWAPSSGAPRRRG
jgi:MFS family permease